MSNAREVTNDWKATKQLALNFLSFFNAGLCFMFIFVGMNLLHKPSADSDFHLPIAD